MMATPNPPHDEVLLESPMKRIAVVLCLLATAAVSAVTAQQGFKNIKEYLSGYEEVPAVSTSAGAQFDATISNDGTEINWELSYSALEGSYHAVAYPRRPGGRQRRHLGVPLQQSRQPPRGHAGMPRRSGDDLRHHHRGHVIGPGGQGVAAGQLDELIAAMRAGATYVNIHSTTWPGGEVRSQIDGNNSHSH